LYCSVIYNTLDYYASVNSKHEEYRVKRQEELERDLETINDIKVKVIRDESDKIIAYESPHKFDRYCNC